MPQMNLPYIQAPRAEKPPDQQTFEEESSQLGFEIALSRLNRVSPILSPSPPGDVAARSSDSQAALRRRLECPEGRHALGQQASALARLPGRYAPGGRRAWSTRCTRAATSAAGAPPAHLCGMRSTALARAAWETGSPAPCAIRRLMHTGNA